MLLTPFSFNLCFIIFLSFESVLRKKAGVKGEPKLGPWETANLHKKPTMRCHVLSKLKNAGRIFLLYS